MAMAKYDRLTFVIAQHCIGRVGALDIHIFEIGVFLGKYIQKWNLHGVMPKHVGGMSSGLDNFTRLQLSQVFIIVVTATSFPKVVVMVAGKE
jgi:hypothetical protein